MFGIKNGCLQTDGFEMDYIRFGTGAKTLILLPGLGDGLQTVRGLALPMALLYRVFMKEYTVYSFSRRRDLPDGHTTRDMARDQKQAMDALGIPAADVVGVSMGGMIAQHLAADYPEMVGKLVLVVTSVRPNPILIGSVADQLIYLIFGIDKLGFFARFGRSLLILPLVTGVSYEVLKGLAHAGDNLLVRILRWPGLQLQRLTTREPDDQMLEVAIASMKAAKAGADKYADELDDGVYLYVEGEEKAEEAAEEKAEEKTEEQTEGAAE